MNQGYLSKQLSKASTRALLAVLFTLALAIGVIALSQRHLRAYFAGPKPVEREAVLAAESDMDFDHTWVTLDGDEMISTGIEFTKKNSRSGTIEEQATYYVMALDDRFLLVKRDGIEIPNAPPTQTGWLTAISSTEQKEVVDDIGRSEPGLKELLLPYKMETREPSRFNAFLIIAAILASIGLFIKSVLSWLRTRNIASHAVGKYLARFGALDQVVAQINAEIPPDTKATTIISPNWLVQRNSIALNVRKTQDLVWAYRYTLTTKSYGITTGKQQSVRVHDKDGKMIECVFGKNEKDADAFMTDIINRAPWILAGHSAELENTWKKNRAAILTAVEERHRQYATARASAASI